MAMDKAQARILWEVRERVGASFERQGPVLCKYNIRHTNLM